MMLGVIGAGAIGRAIAFVLRNRDGVTVEFWDKNETQVPEQKPLSEIVTRADVIFICVSSFAVRAVAEALTPHVAAQTPVISVAKGLEPATHKTMDEVLRDVLPAAQPMAMLCGPMLADEMRRGMPAIGTVGTSTRGVFTTLYELFSGTMLRIEYSRDMHGVAVASVLKNIYAIGVGIGEGLGYGNNWRGWFMHRALPEMMAVLQRLGGEPATAYSSAGLGDFIATGSSPYSRNHTAGQELGTQGQTMLLCEGLLSLPSLLHLVGSDTRALPLLAALQKIIIEKHHAQPIFHALFSA